MLAFVISLLSLLALVYSLLLLKDKSPQQNG